MASSEEPKSWGSLGAETSYGSQVTIPVPTLSLGVPGSFEERVRNAVPVVVTGVSVLVVVGGMGGVAMQQGVSISI